MARARELLERPEPPAAEQKRILRERARALAQAPTTAPDFVSGAEAIVFRLGEERFALPLLDVAEVIAHPAIVPAPGAPEGIAGVIQVRGEIRPVFQLARLLDMVAPAGEVVLLARHGQREFGIETGRVEEIRAFRGDFWGAAGDLRGLPVTSDLVQILSLELLVAEIQGRFGEW